MNNDDTEVFLKLYLLLYADDTVIFAESPDELQVALDRMKKKKKNLFQCNRLYSP